MRLARAHNATTGRSVAERVLVADGWWTRLRGLLFRPPLAPSEGLLIVPCRSVHMLGMRYPIDVVFLDGEGTVVALYEALPPGGRSGWHRAARQALELPAGTIATTGTRVGDVVVVGSRAESE